MFGLCRRARSKGISGRGLRRSLMRWYIASFSGVGSAGSFGAYGILILSVGRCVCSSDVVACALFVVPCLLILVSIATKRCNNENEMEHDYMSEKGLPVGSCGRGDGRRECKTELSRMWNTTTEQTHGLRIYLSTPSRMRGTLECVLGCGIEGVCTVLRHGCFGADQIKLRTSLVPASDAGRAAKKVVKWFDKRALYRHYLNARF